MAVEEARRGDVLLVDLSPTRGPEIRKTTPCLVVSPDELNARLTTLIVHRSPQGATPIHSECPAGSMASPVTSSSTRFGPSTARGWSVLGALAPSALAQSLAILREMFAP